MAGKTPELDRLVRIDQAVEDIPIEPSAGNVLTHLHTLQILRGGYQITLTTPDAEKYPLPDERLIELQWFLARVLRMSGDYDDAPMISPVTSMDSLVSFRTESPTVESSVASPANSPPRQLLFSSFI